MEHDTFIRRYLTDLYGQRRIDLVGYFIGDPQTRHAGGETITLTLADNIERIAGYFATHSEFEFWPELLAVSDDLVTCAWNANLTPLGGTRLELSGVEVFRIADGRIVEVWNSKEAHGHWGT